MGIAERKWLQVYRCEAVSEQTGRCYYCLRPITAGNATADHYWPKARRGQSRKDNIVAACRDCNNAKADMAPAAFFKLIKRGHWRTGSQEIWMIWATRRIWKRAHKACERITARAV